MKKILTKILTSIVMITVVLSFTACGSKGEKAESEVLEAYDSAEIESSITTKSSKESNVSAGGLQEDTEIAGNSEKEFVTDAAVPSKKKSDQKQTTKKEVVSKADTSGQSANYSSAKTTTKTTTKSTTKATVAEEDKNMLKIEIIVGNKSFSATLYDNAAAKALLEMFPMTLNMSELNGNEKYFYLDNNLPTNSSRPSGIEAGDIMLYGNNCLVLFYESFSTSYSYTPLGRIDDPKGLAEALGSGSVQVTFRKG